MNANEYQVGQVLNAVSVSLDSRRTEPPEHYTEDTLLADMLAAHKFASTDADREMLKQVSGIGTSRTRATVLSSMVKRGLLIQEKKGKRHQLRISEAGKQLLEGLPANLKDVAMTAKWERALDMVAKGEVPHALFRTKVVSILNEQIPVLLKPPATRGY
jgi:DNA topoisomerase-3